MLKQMLAVVMDGVKDTNMMADYAKEAYKHGEASAAAWFKSHAQNRFAALERDWRDVCEEMRRKHKPDDVLDALTDYVDGVVTELRKTLEAM